MKLVDKAREVSKEAKDDYEKSAPRRKRWGDAGFYYTSYILITAAAAFLIYGLVVLLSVNIVPQIFSGVATLTGINTHNATVQSVLALWIAPSFLLILFLFAFGLYCIKFIWNRRTAMIVKIERYVYPDRFTDAVDCTRKDCKCSCQKRTAKCGRSNKRK